MNCIKLLGITSLIFLFLGCQSELSVPLVYNALDPDATAYDCKLELYSNAYKEVEEDLLVSNSSIQSDPINVKLDLVNTSTPTITDSTGYSSDLVPVSFAGNENTLYMLEVTGFGNLNVWTLYTDQNLVTVSKQYSANGAYSQVMIGQCAPTYSVNDEVVVE